MKTVNYFGTNYTVPDYAKFIATDGDGECWWYTVKPRCSKFLNVWQPMKNPNNLCGRLGYKPVKHFERSLQSV